MPRGFLWAIAVSCAGLAGLLVAQGGEGGRTLETYKREYNMAQLLASEHAPLSQEVRKGRNIWLQRCAYCHDGVGTPTYNTLGPYLDAALVQARGDAAVRAKILDGSARMPAFKHGLRSEQVDQVIAFLKTIGPEHRPTAEQLKGAAGALPAGDL
jgi:mono/diheme cytochrome c family protein